MALVCPQCGHQNDSAATFCAQCGTSLAPQGANATDAARIPGGKTVLGIPARDMTPAAPPAAPVAGAPDARVPSQKTQLGMPGMPAAPAAPAASPNPLPGPAITAPVGASKTVLGIPGMGVAAPPPSDVPLPPSGAQKTMLGVAIPGIAPLQPGSNAPVPPSAMPMPTSGAARIAVENEHRTMLGVPVAGEAPPAPANNPLYTASIPIAPAPGALELEPLPAAPRKVARKGFPLGIVAGALAAIVGGILVTFIVLTRGGSPLVVQPRLSEKGTDVLHLSCDSCPDGTKVAMGNASASFTNKEADLELPTPLAVGENALVLSLERPGRRAEDVKAPVPLRYRVRTDLSGLAEKEPFVRVNVEVEKGASVKIDGKPLTLDESGKGTLTADLSAETTGMADESKTIDKVFPYEVTLKDKTEKGSVTARASVPALHVDAPLLKTVIATDRFFVAGRTIKGATITINGRPSPVDATGIFAEAFGAPTAAEMPIEVRASLPQAASRTVSLKIRRADAIESQARALDKTLAPIPYSQMLGDSAPAIGKLRAVEGEVVQIREINHQSRLAVRDKRACDREGGECVVRLLHGASIDVKPGARVLAIGKVSRNVTADGKTFPEIEAEMVVPLGRGK